MNSGFKRGWDGGGSDAAQNMAKRGRFGTGGGAVPQLMSLATPLGKSSGGNSGMDLFNLAGYNKSGSAGGMFPDTGSSGYGNQFSFGGGSGSSFGGDPFEVGFGGQQQGYGGGGSGLRGQGEKGGWAGGSGGNIGRGGGRGSGQRGNTGIGQGRQSGSSSGQWSTAQGGGQAWTGQGGQGDGQQSKNWGGNQGGGGARGSGGQQSGLGRGGGHGGGRGGQGGGRGGQGGGRGGQGGGRGGQSGGRGGQGGGRGGQGGGRGGQSGGRGGRGGQGGAGRGGFQQGGKSGGRGGQGQGGRGGRGGGSAGHRGPKTGGRLPSDKKRTNHHTLLTFSERQRRGAQNQNPSLLESFQKLCAVAQRNAQRNSASLGVKCLESYIGQSEAFLDPAYVFIGERKDDLQPFEFKCKVYMSNIFIAYGIASNKKDAKRAAAQNAVHVLASTSPEFIVYQHERCDVMALSEREADIVECPFKSAESNIGNILSLPQNMGITKSMADFYILEPEHVDQRTGMNSTCILRQSADFSHLLLKYEFTKSNLKGGFECTVIIEGDTVAKATATTQVSAKNLASHAALENLRKTNWTLKIVRRDKPVPAITPLTATFGSINPQYPASRANFYANAHAYLITYFSNLDDLTKWLPLSAELNQDERDVIYDIAKANDLKVESRRVDGRQKRKAVENQHIFLTVSKKMLCQDLFDYIWEKGGETWRYKLVAPGSI